MDLNFKPNATVFDFPRSREDGEWNEKLILKDLTLADVESIKLRLKSFPLNELEFSKALLIEMSRGELNEEVFDLMPVYVFKHLVKAAEKFLGASFKELM